MKMSLLNNYILQAVGEVTLCLEDVEALSPAAGVDLSPEAVALALRAVAEVEAVLMEGAGEEALKAEDVGEALREGAGVALKAEAEVASTEEEEEAQQHPIDLEEPLPNVWVGHLLVMILHPNEADMKEDLRAIMVMEHPQGESNSTN